MASTQIERHIRGRGAANPYGPRYAQYFQKRRSFIGRTRWAKPSVGSTHPA